MRERYDAVVIGAGPAGEVAISRLAGRGLRVALVERELVGGECAYWACIPSKTLLRPPEARAAAGRAAGLVEPALHWPELAAYRDWMIRNLDDAAQVEGYRRMGVDVRKGVAEIIGPQRIRVHGETIETARIVVATGSEAVVPPIPGLEAAGYWTNREATTARELPESVIVLGGGPVGIELGQLLRRLGAAVTILETAERLISRETRAVGQLAAQALAADGIEVRCGTEVREVSVEGGRRTVRLADGERLRAHELLVATGRRPRVAGLGLEAVGIEPRAEGIAVDERCRAGEGVWAVGDVTGVMPFTHVGKYQARVACADIAGRPIRADYRAIPRVIFSDPEIAAVGLSEEQARADGHPVAAARVHLPEAIARPWTYEREPRGDLGLVADRERGVLLGAWAVAPLAGEWIHQAALAIKTETPLRVLRDTVAQFPTFSEAYLPALEALDA